MIMQCAKILMAASVASATQDMWAMDFFAVSEQMLKCGIITAIMIIASCRLR